MRDYTTILVRIFTALLFVVGLAGTSAGQPTQRIKLTQLEQAPNVAGSRQGQIGMSDVAGNQRYTPYVLISDTCTTTPPAASGNTNISQFVYNCAGDSIWYIDWKGDAILLVGGAGGCDADWLDIVANDCPDSVNDSIYTYQYASVGARYAWPLAEFLVNDSSSTAIAVIQGSRNARLGFHDSQNDTWTAINHGGITSTWYLQRGSELVVTAADGSISIPTIPFTNHFAIRTADSTIVFFQYPNTRTDTNTVVNLLHTDANGVVKSGNLANSLNGIGFGNVMYHDDTDSGPERVGSWLNRFNGTFVSALDSLLANTTEGARVEISPGQTTLSSYPSVAKNGKKINILGGPGSYLNLAAQFSYSSPDTADVGALVVQVDTLQISGLLTNANATRVQPSNHAIRLEANTILNSVSVSKSTYTHLRAKNWVTNTGTYLLNPVFTEQKRGDTVTNVSALLEIDQITLTGTGTSPRAVSYLNSTFDSCALEYRIGSIKKGAGIPAATGRGFGVHVYSYGSTDTTVVKNSKINTTVGSVSLEGTGASDNPFICFRPGAPGGGTDYPIYVQGSQINYDLGAVGLSEKLIEFSSRTEISNSEINTTCASCKVTNDNGIYFQRVNLDSTTIIFEGNYTSTAAGAPLIYLDSVTFTNGARIIFRGRFEHQSAGTPVVQILNCADEPAGSIIFENATLVAQDTPTVVGSATITARGLVTTRAPQNTITVAGVHQQGAALQVTDLTATPATIGAWSSDGYASKLVPGTNLSISGNTLNATGGGGASLPAGEIGYGDGASITSSPNLLASPASSSYRVSLDAQNVGQGFTADNIATGGDGYATTSAATGSGSVNALDGVRTDGSGTYGVSISHTGTGPAQYYAASTSGEARTVYDGAGQDWATGYSPTDSAYTIGGGTNLADPAVQVKKDYSVVATAAVSNTNTAANRLVIRTNSTGTPAAGFGGGILFQGESSTTDNRDMGQIYCDWVSATDASRYNNMRFLVSNIGGGLTEALKISATSGLQIGGGVTSYTNSSITTATSYLIGGSSSTLTLSSSANGANAIVITGNGNNSSGIRFGNGNNFTSTTLQKTKLFISTDNYSASSGSGYMNAIEISDTYNLTGTASGVQVGIKINPTLSSLANGSFLGVEMPFSDSASKGIYQTGANTTNNFVGGTVFGSTSAPDAAAALEVNSTTKGFLLPRMTTAERDAIGSPPDGLMIYNTTTSKAQVRAGGAWVDLH